MQELLNKTIDKLPVINNDYKLCLKVVVKIVITQL